MTRKYFGTDGIRGKTGEHPITPEFFIKLGYAAGIVPGVISKDQQLLLVKILEYQAICLNLL
jgi:phosphoglucosamine mutase